MWPSRSGATRGDALRVSGSPSSSDEAVRDTLHVMVVSEDPRVREEARYGLARGWTTSFADDSVDAWRSLERERPSLVVVDLQTGNSGGYALARDMAESSRLRGTPILILLERRQDAWLAGRAGASAFLVKPLRPGELARSAAELSGSN